MQFSASFSDFLAFMSKHSPRYAVLKHLYGERPCLAPIEHTINTVRGSTNTAAMCYECSLSECLFAHKLFSCPRHEAVWGTVIALHINLGDRWK
jgi:hypothetical protein